MTSIETVALEVADPTAAHRSHSAAFGLDTEVALRASEAPTSGFRGFVRRVRRPGRRHGVLHRSGRVRLGGRHGDGGVLT